MGCLQADWNAGVAPRVWRAPSKNGTRGQQPPRREASRPDGACQARNWLPCFRLCKSVPSREDGKNHIEEQGKDRFEAAAEAARLRLRPIVMTSLAFILGVIPPVIATGPGAEMRQALGTVVFFGMIAVTLFGVLFAPFFYVLVRRGAKAQ